MKEICQGKRYEFKNKVLYEDTVYISILFIQQQIRQGIQCDSSSTGSCRLIYLSFRQTLLTNPPPHGRSLSPGSPLQNMSQLSWLSAAPCLSKPVSVHQHSQPNCQNTTSQSHTVELFKVFQVHICDMFQHVFQGEVPIYVSLLSVIKLEDNAKRYID